VVGVGGRAGRGCFAPAGDGEGADVFSWAGEVRGDGEPGGGAAGGEEGGEELVVPVWGFDKELGAVVACAVGFEGSDGSRAAGGVDGEVAVELELLAVEAAGHKSEEDGTWADEWADGGAGFVGDGGEELAGVGDAGAAGFGEDADGGAARQRGAKGAEDFGFGLVDSVPLVLVYDHFFPEHFDVTAGGAFVFDEEDGAGFDGVEDIGGEGSKGLLIEVGGDEIDGGGCDLHVLHFLDVKDGANLFQILMIQTYRRGDDRVGGGEDGYEVQAVEDHSVADREPFSLADIGDAGAG
jgi:hypothetical protein